MKIAYITAHAPFGCGETFILEEMKAMIELGEEVLIIPRNPPKKIFHDEARQLISRTMRLPLLNWEMLFKFIKAIALSPHLRALIRGIIENSRTPRILLKNLCVVPKAVFVADLIRRARVEHIHAHWGSTTSTIGWLASEISGIPWSMTLHRWDIAENNMLKKKVESASFTRCISDKGMQETLCIVGANYKSKLIVIHMGVRINDNSLVEPHLSRSEFVIACPANLVRVKGHKYLIEALDLINKREGFVVRCYIIGDGPLKKEIRSQIRRLGLQDVINMVGNIPHEKLMGMYKAKQIDLVALPSIITDDGEKEGIPVALMEAMSCGIPTISTKTGSIPELLSGGAGILVNEKSSVELAKAINTLIKDKNKYYEIAYRGKLRVKEDFDLRKNVKLLLKEIEKYKY
ncbi:MAG: glycosyltransferase [Candidatus Anstonellales archaeon]